MKYILLPLNYKKTKYIKKEEQLMIGVKLAGEHMCGVIKVE